MFKALIQHSCKKLKIEKRKRKNIGFQIFPEFVKNLCTIYYSQFNPLPPNPALAPPNLVICSQSILAHTHTIQDPILNLD